MSPRIYFSFATLLVLFAYIVLRRIVRRTYLEHGELGLGVSLLQLLVFTGYFGFAYFIIPPGWPWFWRFSDPATRAYQAVGFALVCLGLLSIVFFMTWFGIRRAFGLQVEGLVRTGPYRLSRNPQLLGGYLLVLGLFIQWPGWYVLGWLVMYPLITHWMVMTEEEHLVRVFGPEYERYCREVPRYLFRRTGLLVVGLALLLGGCRAGPGDAVDVAVGAGLEEVREQLGEPQREQDFIMPEVPFFGPQESLTDLVPAGTLVKEWVYSVGEEELYVWFASAQGAAPDLWRVVATGRYPAGAVF
jgi:protein-S-isoprenylcysteine O-methyltransferase Ste14